MSARLARNGGFVLGFVGSTLFYTLFLAGARHTVDGGAKQRCLDLMNSLMKNSNYFTERVNLLRVAFVQGNRHKGKVSEGW